MSTEPSPLAVRLYASYWDIHEARALDIFGKTTAEVSRTFSRMAAMVEAEAQRAIDDARKEARLAALREAKVCVHSKIQNCDKGCEYLGGMDMETGATECSLELRGGDCLCSYNIELGDDINDAIQTLIAAEEGK